MNRRVEAMLRALRRDIANSRLSASATRNSIISRIDDILVDEPPECRCTNPIEPSAICPVHGIKPGDDLVSADGSKVKFGGSQ